MQFAGIHVLATSDLQHRLHAQDPHGFLSLGLANQAHIGTGDGDAVPIGGTSILRHHILGLVGRLQATALLRGSFTRKSRKSASAAAAPQLQAGDGVLWGLAAVLELTGQGSSFSLSSVCHHAVQLAELDASQWHGAYFKLATQSS